VTNRREFIRKTAIMGGAVTAGLVAPDVVSSTALALTKPALIPRAAKPIRILILGGTGFIGPNQVRYALARGHAVTLFNRGRTNPGLFPNVEHLQGDRAPNPGDYKSLEGREWDVVIDNPTTRPRWVREAAAALQGRVKQYVFVSTISVYATNDTPGADETAAVLTTETPDVESGPEFQRLYGPLKALSEKEAEKAFPGHVTIIRPGLIVGVGDTSDRYTYWPVRIARGGEVLAPPADDPVQFIDARDLGEWTVRCCEEETVGVFNATGPARRFTVREMLEGARDVVKSSATFTHVASGFLSAQRVRGWSDLPVWIAPEGRNAGFTQRSIARALAKGLTFRPYTDTVRETLAFYNGQTPERKAELRAGITAAREKEVLAAWHAR
jgi:2'-hydroxyisoflavone reductase